MSESVQQLSSVLTRLYRAQDMGIIPRRDQRVYDQAIGNAYGRMERMNNDSSRVEQQELRRLYGDQIDELQSPAGVEMSATPLFQSLFDHIFDPGANRRVACTIPGVLEPFTEDAVPVLSRASLIDRTLEKTKENNSQVQIGLIDLKDLRSADFHMEGQTHKAADVIINKAAKAIRRGLEEAWKDPQIGIVGNTSLSYEIGRYGGDEFIFSLFGDITVEQRTAIMQKVQESLSFERGYYERHDHGKTHIESDTLRLKEDSTGKKVDWITFPSDPLEKKIFTEYFQRGLLLKPDEFQRVIEKYETDGTFDMQKYRADYPEGTSFYPENVQSIEEKMRYIEEHHPEFSMYFDLARIYDAEGPKGTQTRQSIILKTIESSIFDPLLGEAIYSRFDFQEHFNLNEFTSVFVFDLKFMKEMNEGMTYADADKAITNFWKIIRSTIQTREERSKFYISRFGGTFLIGVKKGAHIDEQTMNRLQGLLNIPVSLYQDRSGNDVRVPIGSSQWKVESKTALSSYLRQTDSVMYHRLVEELIALEIEHPGSMNDIMKFDISTPNRNHSPMQHVELYARFLRGKRTQERVSALYNEKNKVYGVALAYKRQIDSRIRKAKKIVDEAIEQLYAFNTK